MHKLGWRHDREVIAQRQKVRVAGDKVLGTAGNQCGENHVIGTIFRDGRCRVGNIDGNGAQVQLFEVRLDLAPIPLEDFDSSIPDRFRSTA